MREPLTDDKRDANGLRHPRRWLILRSALRDPADVLAALIGASPDLVGDNGARPTWTTDYSCGVTLQAQGDIAHRRVHTHSAPNTCQVAISWSEPVRRRPVGRRISQS